MGTVFSHSLTKLPEAELDCVGVSLQLTVKVMGNGGGWLRFPELFHGPADAVNKCLLNTYMILSSLMVPRILQEDKQGFHSWEFNSQKETQQKSFASPPACPFLFPNSCPGALFAKRRMALRGFILKKASASQSWKVHSGLLFLCCLLTTSGVHWVPSSAKSLTAAKHTAPSSATAFSSPCILEKLQFSTDGGLGDHHCLWVSPAAMSPLLSNIP